MPLSRRDFLKLGGNLVGWGAAGVLLQPVADKLVAKEKSVIPLDKYVYRDELYVYGEHIPVYTPSSPETGYLPHINTPYLKTCLRRIANLFEVDDQVLSSHLEQYPLAISLNYPDPIKTTATFVYPNISPLGLSEIRIFPQQMVRILNAFGFASNYSVEENIHGLTTIPHEFMHLMQYVKGEIAKIEGVSSAVLTGTAGLSAAGAEMIAKRANLHPNLQLLAYLLGIIVGSATASHFTVDTVNDLEHNEIERLDPRVTNELATQNVLYPLISFTPVN